MKRLAAYWALFNEMLMIISAVIAVFGWRQIRKKNREVHRRLMMTSSLFGAGFFISYAVATFVIGDTSYGGPSSLAVPYQIFLQIHVMLATIAAVMGVVTIVLALRSRFSTHRRIGPFTVVFWLVSAATGLVVYLMLFVIFPPGPTIKNLIHVLFSSKS